MYFQRKDDLTPVYFSDWIELTSGISSTSEPPGLCSKGTRDRHSENIWKLKVLPNDTVCYQKISTPSAHTSFFQFCSSLVSTSTSAANNENHGLGPRQGDLEVTAPSLFCARPWHDRVVSCLGSKQTSPPRSVFTLEAWHKVSSNLLISFLLDSGPVFPVIPEMELLECQSQRKKPNLLSVFLSPARPNSNKCLVQQYYVEPRIWPNIS